MSWLARTLASPFQDSKEEEESRSSSDDAQKPKGVKEDFSQITDAFRKQLRVAANFIAPPPENSKNSPSKDKEIEKEQELKEGKNEGRDGFQAEISNLTGRVKTGFSRISNALNTADGANIQASISSRLAGVAKFASKILSPDVENAVGVTDEVRSFAANVSQHPGTWLNFPLHAIDNGEFDMTDAQQEHALAVEFLTPSLADLRSELCPQYMNEGQFWKIYFVLVHSLLSKEDAAILSTPQIMEARALLSQESHIKNRPESVTVERNADDLVNEHNLEPPLGSQDLSLRTGDAKVPGDSKGTSSDGASVPAATQPNANEADIRKVETNNANSANQKPSKDHESKDVAVETPVSLVKEQSTNAEEKQKHEEVEGKPKHENEEEEVDEWLQEEESDKKEYSHSAAKVSHEDDVSFSDLEDNDD